MRHFWLKIYFYSLLKLIFPFYLTHLKTAGSGQVLELALKLAWDQRQFEAQSWSFKMPNIQPALYLSPAN